MSSSNSLLEFTQQKLGTGDRRWLAAFSRPSELPREGLYASYRDRFATGEFNTAGYADPNLYLFADQTNQRLSFARQEQTKVIFDGVLFNQAELGATLAVQNIDTADNAQLILQAYQHWGEEFVYKIKGIFALIIWDGRSDTLLYMRDPIGMYPLFYAESGGQLLFSTSIEVLLAHPAVSTALNRAALVDYLCHRWPDPGETYFAAVRRVLRTYVMRLQHGQKSQYQYWAPVPNGTATNWVREDELGQFDGLLDQAVSRCLQVGPAGIFLSGGFDSVSVAAIATDNSRQQGLPVPQALSLIFPDPECNEEPVQRGVANGLGLPQVTLPFWEAVGGQSLMESALQLAGERPAPLLNPWLPAYSKLSLEGKELGCKVILTGNGGDEWLAVGPSIAADYMLSLDFIKLYQLWAMWRRSFTPSRRMTMHNLLWVYGARPILAGVAHRVVSRLAPEYYRKNRRQRMAEINIPWIAPDAVLRDEVIRRNEQVITMPPFGNYIIRESMSVFEHPVMSMELEENFESGYRLGLSFLHPFWDPDLVDFLLRTPPHLLNRGGRSKGLVRQAVAKRFPALGFEKHKKVAATKFFKSITYREGPTVWAKMGGAPKLAELGIVDAAALEEVMASIFASDQSRLFSRQFYRVWDVLGLEAWVRTHSA